MDPTCRTEQHIRDSCGRGFWVVVAHTYDFRRAWCPVSMCSFIRTQNHVPERHRQKDRTRRQDKACASRGISRLTSRRKENSLRRRPRLAPLCMDTSHTRHVTSTLVHRIWRVRRGHFCAAGARAAAMPTGNRQGVWLLWTFLPNLSSHPKVLRDVVGAVSAGV